MRVVIWVVLAIMVAALAISHSAAASQTGWLAGPPEVKNSFKLDNIPYRRCPFVLTSYKISGVQDEKQVCINPIGSVRVGYYDNNNSTKFVIGFGLDNFLYELDGFDCDHSCLYSPQTDTLITRQYLINGIVKSLVIYDKFSQRLEKINTLTRQSYKLVDTNSSYIFQSSYGYPYPVNGLGLSSNGRYIGIEARSRGFLILDLSNFSIKRISGYAYSYGYGIDPSVEIAVSDDGDNFLAVGVNASIKLFSGLRYCGDDASDNHIMDLVPMNSNDKCPEVNIDTDQFMYRFFYATNPKFSSSGLGVSFFAGSYESVNKFVYLKAFGSQNYSLDLLAMGDSFSSGEGETDDAMYFTLTNSENEKCHTSKRSYPYLLSDSYLRHGASIKSVACSGAVTDDILGQKTSGEYIGQGDRLQNIAGNDSNYLAQLRRDALAEFIPGRIGQLDFVREYNPKIITVGIGGNDLDLVGKLKACIQESTCSYAVDNEEKSKLVKQIYQLHDKLKTLYKTIKSSNPQAGVYAVGYPQVISLDGKCDLLNKVFFNNTERLYIRSVISFTNENIAAAARDSGVRYVDIEDVFGDAALCGSAKELAMNGLTGGDDVRVLGAKVVGNESFHPKPLGHKLIASRIASLYPDMFDVDFCAFSPDECSADTAPPPPPADWPQSLDPETASLTIKQMLNLVSPSDSTSTERSLNLGSYSLEPNSTAVVSVHSSAVELGKFTAGSDGSFAADISLPSDLEYGYHVLTIAGTSYSGEPVEYRQQILLMDPTPIILTAGPADNTPNTTVVTAQTSQQTTNGFSLPAPEFGDPAVLGVTNEKSIDLTKPVNKNEAVSASSSFWLAYLGIGALLIGAPTAYLLIRRVRNTMKA